jgi:hypothetical protein
MPAALRKSLRETPNSDPSMRAILFRLLRPRGIAYPEIVLALSNITTKWGYMSKYFRLKKLFE